MPVEEDSFDLEPREVMNHPSAYSPPVGTFSGRASKHAIDHQ